MQNNASNRISLLTKFFYSLAAFMGFPFFITMGALGFINVNKSDNSREVAQLTQIVSITYILIPLIWLLALACWQWLDTRSKSTKTPINNPQIAYLCVVLCRYLLASLMIFYGLDKLMVNQLNMSYYWYGDELGKISGFQMTWSFFGFSKVYNSIIACIQILGGMLLLFRRTALAGALFLLPVLLNIALIDFNYDIPAKDIITVLLLMDIFLVSISLKPLIAFFFFQKNVDGASLIANYSGTRQYPVFVKALAIVGIVFFGFITNYRQIPIENKSPLDGAWEATSVKNYSDSIPEKNQRLTLRVFIENNIATIKKTYQYQDFYLTKDSLQPNGIKLTAIKENEQVRNISGTYRNLGKDSLLFSGKDGNDSVQWMLKKTSR